MGGAAATYNLSASITASATPVFSVTGNSFSAAASACSLSGGVAACTVPLSFSPQYPGLQTGALYAKDASGHLLATYFLRGVGLAGQTAFLPGTASTLAGNGTWGYTDGALTSAAFRNPSGLAVDQAGNVYVADSVNQVVRKVSATAVSTVAGSGVSGYSGDGAAATAAKLNNPTGVALDAANNVYIADQGNNVIRRVDAVSGVITTVAGGGSTLVTAASSNVAATSAILYGTQAVAVDPAGNLFLSTSFYQMVLRVDAGTGVITVYAGGGTGGGTDGLGDGGAATSALLSNPTGLALDASGDLFIADTGDNMIREVNVATGVISAVAGSGNYGYTGDLGPAINASLASPAGVRVDAAGNIYIADFGNNVIRQTLAALGSIVTLMGTGTSGYTGDGAVSTSATLASPSDVAIGATGTLFIADYANNVIRQIKTSPLTLSFANTVVGTASQTQSVTLANRGNQALTLSGVSVGAGFQRIAGSNDCTATTVLASGGSCSVVIDFVPAAAGAVTSSLSFSTNSLNATGTQTVGLSGTGVAGNAPKAVLSASSLSFGTAAVGSSSSQTVTLTNSGTAALTISAISLTGSGGGNAFSLATACGASLGAGSSCTNTVTFAPMSAGSYSASLIFNDSAGNTPQTVTLNGSASGGANSTLNSSSLTFSALINATSAAQSVILSNTSSVVLNIASIALSGPNSADFGYSTSCTPVVAVGSSCAVSLAFTPGAAGTRAATLTIVDNTPASPHVIALTGTGNTAPATAVFSPGSLAFGGLAVGARSSTQTITLSNGGGSPLPVSGISIANSSPPSFAVVSNSCGTSLAAGASCLIGVAFLPAVTGPLAGSVILSSSSGLTAVTSVSGSGTIGGITDGIYDDRDPRISYTGTWGGDSETGRYAGTQSYSHQAGSAATFTFTGTQIAFVYETQSNTGYAQISIDGAVVTPSLDQYSPSLLPQVRMVYSGLSNATHTISVTVLGLHDANATDAYIIVDAFIVGTPATLYDDSDPEINYVGTWGHGTDVGRYAGTQSYSNQPGAVAVFSFTGTQVTYVYETQYNMGHAQVSIDGNVVTADVDEYTANLVPQQKLLYSGLSNGVHTIKVMALGLHDSASAGAYVIVDAFVVGPNTAGTYDDSHPAISYSGAWGHGSDVGRYNGTQSYSNEAGDTVSFAFTGTQVAYVYETQYNMGHAQVSIDGNVVSADIDEYSAIAQFQKRAVYTGLSNSPHVITVSVLGTQDAASAAAYVITDGFLVGALANTYDDWDPAVIHSGNWGEGPDVGRYDGTQSYSLQAGASVSLTFTGSQVVYVFEKQSNLGYAQVSIDGSTVTAAYDQYSAALQAQQQLVYGGLSSGTHTITVSVVGTHDSVSAAAYVVIDAFIVSP